jgi:hypothetical protein
VSDTFDQEEPGHVRLAARRVVDREGWPADLAEFYAGHEGVGLDNKDGHCIRMAKLAEVTTVGLKEIGFDELPHAGWASFSAFVIGASDCGDEILYVRSGPGIPAGSVFRPSTFPYGCTEAAAGSPAAGADRGGGILHWRSSFARAPPRPLIGVTLSTQGGPMTTTTRLAFILLPMALLTAAAAIHHFRLWDVLANFTLPWFCSALAVSLLILGTICLILDVPPSMVPPRVAWCTVGGTVVIFGAGMIVDGISYHPKPHDRFASVGGWIGFAIILGGVFALARGPGPCVKPETSPPALRGNQLLL